MVTVFACFGGFSFVLAMSVISVVSFYVDFACFSRFVVLFQV